MSKIIKKKNISTQTIAAIGLMTALYVGLYLVKIPLSPESRISVTFIPVALAGYLLGPGSAMIVGFLGDILSCIFLPSQGPYFPGFTLSAIITGLIYGVFYCKKYQTNIWTIILANIIVVVFINILLNTLWITIMYKKAFFVYLVSRGIKNIIILPIQIVITYLMIKTLQRTGITKKFR